MWPAAVIVPGATRAEGSDSVGAPDTRLPFATEIWLAVPAIARAAKAPLPVRATRPVAARAASAARSSSAGCGAIQLVPSDQLMARLVRLKASAPLCPA